LPHSISPLSCAPAHKNDGKLAESVNQARTLPSLAATSTYKNAAQWAAFLCIGVQQNLLVHKSFTGVNFQCLLIAGGDSFQPTMCPDRHQSRMIPHDFLPCCTIPAATCVQIHSTARWGPGSRVDLWSNLIANARKR